VTELPDSIVRIVQVLVEDEDLQLWFEHLESCTPATRARELRETATRMRNVSPDRDIADGLALIATPGVYEAVLASVRELRG
jgi:hypothetical protein